MPNLSKGQIPRTWREIGQAKGCAIRAPSVGLLIPIVFCLWTGGRGSSDGKEYARILPYTLDAPRSSCTHYVAVSRSTLEAKDEKRRSWTARRAQQKGFIIIIMARSKSDESEERNVSCSRTVRCHGTNHLLCRLRECCLSMSDVGAPPQHDSLLSALRRAAAIHEYRRPSFRPWMVLSLLRNHQSSSLSFNLHTAHAMPFIVLGRHLAWLI
jgi:hypothetical protein